nr:ABC transporter substrate-binding protein [Methanoculleus sp. FWC-SCC1]
MSDIYGQASIALLLAFLLVLCSGCVGAEQSADTSGQNTAENGYRTVIDSRGIAVQVPVKIERVVAVSDGLIESVMTVFGEQETIVGVGSKCIQKNYNYTYPTVDGGTYEYRGGMNPVTYLNPRIMSLPLVAEWGGAMNYETVASLEPDVVILRVGSGSLMSKDDEKTQKTIQTIESLGIPLIVLYSPNCYAYSELEIISDEIAILGEVFGKEREAKRLSDYLESQVNLVEERTLDIPESERPSILVFGLSPKHRAEGAAGTAHGLRTTESYMIEDIVHAKNAFRSESGTFQLISTEQILALDPDVIVLCTAWGYHPPEELYSAPYYQNVAELSAVKDHRVHALPWTPCNSDKRLEYPIDVMVIAKAAYPERFADIDLGEWLLDFYKNVYGVDDDTAKALRSAQWMDWCVDTSPRSR